MCMLYVHVFLCVQMHMFGQVCLQAYIRSNQNLLEGQPLALQARLLFRHDSSYFRDKSLTRAELFVAKPARQRVSEICLPPPLWL